MTFLAMVCCHYLCIFSLELELFVTNLLALQEPIEIDLTVEGQQGGFEKKASKIAAEDSSRD